MGEEKKEGALDASLPQIMKDATKEMVKTFQEYSKKHPNGTNTRSVWFSLKQLKLMVEKLSLEEADGVKLYLGQYTDRVISALNKLPSEHAIPNNYAGRNTIIFVATKEQNGVQRDYFENTKNLKSTFIEPENRGGLCPPDVGCDDDSYVVDPNVPNSTFP